jgi:hypothetical protein
MSTLDWREISIANSSFGFGKKIVTKNENHLERDLQ